MYQHCEKIFNEFGDCKIERFIDFSATNKIDNLTCVDYHENNSIVLFII